MGLSGLAQRLAVLGDWGAETPYRPRVAQALQQQHQNKPLAAPLGDNFYPRGEPVQRYLDELPPVPIYPTFGNYDLPALAKQLELFNKWGLGRESPTKLGFGRGGIAPGRR